MTRRCISDVAHSAAGMMTCCCVTSLNSGVRLQMDAKHVTVCLSQLFFACVVLGKSNQIMRTAFFSCLWASRHVRGVDGLQHHCDAVLPYSTVSERSQGTQTNGQGTMPQILLRPITFDDSLHVLSLKFGCTCCDLYVQDCLSCAT